MHLLWDLIISIPSNVINATIALDVCLQQMLNVIPVLIFKHQADGYFFISQLRRGGHSGLSLKTYTPEQYVLYVMYFLIYKVFDTYVAHLCFIMAFLWRITSHYH